jgi:hypothetical protein
MLTFSAALCIYNLRDDLALAMEVLEREYVAEVEGHMQQPEASNDVFPEAVKVFSKMITATVVFGPHAIMDSYGTGSLMDTENEYLEEYMKSEFWNKYRGSDTTIRSRERGKYSNIFGEDQYSPSNVPGIDLEAAGKAKPTPPSHAIKTALRWIIASNRSSQIIDDVIKRFNIGAYIT